jgi:hypothetical protein
LHSITDRTGDGEGIAEDDKRADVGGVVWLQSGMDGNGASWKAGVYPRARFFLLRGVVSWVHLIACFDDMASSARQDFVMRESRQDRAQEIVPEGVGAAAEWIVHLAVMERREHGATGG